MGYIVPEAKTKPKRQLSQKKADRTAIADDIAKLRKARGEVAEVQAYITKLELKIKAWLGDNEEATINNVPVLRYQRSARIAWKQFMDDNPGIASEYTVTKEVKALDEARLLSEHKALVDAYAVRNFTIL